MTRSKRFVSGVVLGYTYQALVMLVGLWLAPFLLRRIGQHDYGVWLIGLQVVAYLGLADIGVIALLPREIAYATGRAGGMATSAELPGIIGRTARVILYQMPLVVIAAVAIWFFLPAESREFRRFIGLILTVFVLLFPLRIFRATIEGLQDLKFGGRAQIFAWIAGTATTVILVLAGAGLFSLAIGWATTQALASAALAYRVWTKFPQVLPTKRSDFSSAGAGDYIKRGLWASMSQLAQPLISGADILIIGKVLGAAAVVPYNCTGKLIGILGNQPQMLLESAVPGLSEIKAGESKAHIFQVTSALTQASLLVSGAVAAVVVAVNQGFVSWWVGPGLYSGHALSFLIVLTMLLRHLNVTAVYSMFCYGLERRLSLITLVDGVVTFGASAGLIAWLGPIGGPIGSMLGVCLISLPGNLSGVAREAGVSLFGLLRPLFPWFWRFVLVLGVASVMVKEWAPRSFVQTAVAGAVAGLVYVAVMLTIGRKSVLWPYLRPRVMPIWNMVSVKLG